MTAPGFDPQKFLALATQLAPDANHPSEEARARACLGRAYYSLMLTIRGRINIAKGKHIDNDVAGGNHGALYTRLRDCGISPFAGMGKALEDLYDWRQAADYTMDPRDLGRTKKLGSSKHALAMIGIADYQLRLAPKTDFTPVKNLV